MAQAGGTTLARSLHPPTSTRAGIASSLPHLITIYRIFTPWWNCNESAVLKTSVRHYASPTDFQILEHRSPSECHSVYRCFGLSFLPRATVSAVFAVARCPSLSCLSVCLSRWCIVSRWVKISSHFFLIPVAPSFYFLMPSDAQLQEKPLQWGAQNARGGILRLSTEIAVYFGNGTR